MGKASLIEQKAERIELGLAGRDTSKEVEWGVSR